MLSSDGGGFFNANSAHPFENPTPLTNLVEMMLIFVIGVALTNTFGRMVGDDIPGWALLATMAFLLAAGVIMIYAVKAQSKSIFQRIRQSNSDTRYREASERQHERKGSPLRDCRFVIDRRRDNRFLEAGQSTPCTSSFMLLAGAVLMMNMMLDEVIVGGVGSGLYGILLFCIVTVFVAGLMIGRTPEYVGKKIEATEIKMSILALLCVPAAILDLTAVAVVIEPGLAGRANAGPHGFSEYPLRLYFGDSHQMAARSRGLNASTAFYNLTLSLAMFISQFFVIIPVLAIAGNLAAKRIVPRPAGTLPTGDGLFVGFLAAVILIVGGLTFFPAIVLGPRCRTSRDAARTAF